MHAVNGSGSVMSVRSVLRSLDRGYDRLVRGLGDLRVTHVEVRGFGGGFFFFNPNFFSYKI